MVYFASLCFVFNLFCLLSRYVGQKEKLSVDTTAYRISLFLHLENILFDSVRVSNNYFK